MIDTYAEEDERRKKNNNNYYQGCLLANDENNCYYFFCEKRGNCEQFKQFQKEKERAKNGESETK